MPGSRGLTLIELLISMAILGITLGIAIPSFASLIRDTRLTTVINEMHGALFFTRSESIKRGQRVTMCTSIDQTSCATGVGWHGGWLVFDDGNANGTRDADETILRVGMPLTSGISVTGNNPVKNYVSYISTGSTRSISGALQMGTITACSDQRVRQIVISATGRPRVVRDGVC